MVVGAAWERMQASWCYRGAEAVGWCSMGAGERMQASGGYRGAGGSVLVAMGAGERMQGASWCYRGAEAVRWFYRCNLPAVAIGVLVALCWWLWVQQASGGVFFVFCCFLFCFLLVFPRFRKLIAIKINIPPYNTAFYVIFYIFLGILKLR